MRDLGLPARIRAKGVPVVEVAGWQTRGISDGFGPRGALFHHTAGAPSGSVPSLATVIYGRTGIAGPLSQVLQSRDPVQDKAYVIASGKANHAGRGYWHGLDSNYELHGLEVEHVGTTTVPVRRLETSARIIAAMLEAPGSTRDAAYAALHREYALPAGRKIDFALLAPWTPATFRARVAYWIGRTPDAPTPPSTPTEDTMVIKRTNGTAFLLSGGILAAIKTSADVKALDEAGVPTSPISERTWAVMAEAYKVVHGA